MSVTRRTFLAGAVSCCTLSTLPILASITKQDAGSPEKADVVSHLLKEHWDFYRGPLDPSFQVWHSEELVRWEKVTLPHCFNHYDACDPDTPAYRGQGWYRTKLSLANPYERGRTLLHFEGAGQSSQIYIGTQKVADHIGGYDEFVVDITDAVANTTTASLAVMCDNGRDLQRLPSDLSDFTLYGGLYRAVHLVYVPAVSMEAVHTNVTWEPGQDAHVLITGRVYAPNAQNDPLQLQITLTDPKGNILSQQTIHQTHAWTGEKELAHVTIKDPLPWSPEAPHLYRCDVALLYANQTTRSAHAVGICHTRWEEHGPFFLNGKRLPLRGTQRHEDHAFYAAAMPDDLIRQEMQMIKDMGVNFIRLAHYQQSRLVLDLCDQLGILVWEEVPWCRSGVVSALFKERGRTMLHRMIDQHRNHVSILLWGLGNEDDWPDEPQGEDREAIRNYMTELRDLAHSLDPSRMTSYRRCDFAMDIPDVYSPSIWAGWYSGVYTEYRSALEKWRPQVKHFFHAEWGADSHAGRHAEDADPVMQHIVTGGSTAEKGFDYKLSGGTLRMAKDGAWTETYACDLFDWYLKTIEEVPWLTGTAQWVFKDFTTPLRVDNPVPRINQKGLVTRDMQPKESYYVFQSYWAEKPMLHIYGQNWPMRWGQAGQKRMVRIYSNCKEVELFHNGKSLGKRARKLDDFPCSGLRWDVAFVEGANDLRAVTIVEQQTLEDNVSFQYEVRSWDKPHSLSLTKISQTATHSRVEVTLLDATGVRCLDARSVVRFTLAGAGKLVDNLGTPTGSRVVQLYNGRAEIQVEHTEAVTVGVSSAHLPTALLQI